MRRVLSTVLAVALLLGLGALAVLALPNANASLAGAPAVSAAAPEFAPDAPNATTMFNMIALPLKSSASFAYTASGLLSYLNTPTAYALQVMSWDPTTQGYLFRYFDGFGDDFPLATGGAYLLEVDANAPGVASFVGDVPIQGETTFNFVGASPSCKWNHFSLPLDRSDVTKASELITSMGGSANVEQVASWDAASQGWLFLFNDGFGDDFSVKIGYPYAVCMFTNTPWPQ